MGDRKETQFSHSSILYLYHIYLIVWIFRKLNRISRLTIPLLYPLLPLWKKYIEVKDYSREQEFELSV